MLKNISPIISPELLKILMEMGHGDEIVIGDGNFLKLMPLDTYVEAPVALMDNGDPDNCPPIWSAYKATVTANEGDKEFELVERFAFYERAKKAYAVVATGETAIYANIILKKGVVIQ
mgnify:CR=1 FL=1